MLEACATIVFITSKTPLKHGDYTLPAKFVFHSACFPQRILIKYPLTVFYCINHIDTIVGDVVIDNNVVVYVLCTSCLLSVYINK